MKIPQTLQGTSGLTTVPASSMTRERFFGARPTLANCALKASPVNRMDKYCSPINVLTPMPVIAAPVITEPALLNKLSTFLKYFE